MSGGKRKVPKRKTYTEGEYVRAVRMAVDDAVIRLMLMYTTAVVEMYNPTAEQVADLLERMRRYDDFEQNGWVKLKDYSDVLSKHGIDLRLSRWR